MTAETRTRDLDELPPEEARFDQGIAPDQETGPEEETGPDQETGPHEGSVSKRGSTRRMPWSRRVGGVAPMVRPPGRIARWRASKRWSRRGFVPLGPRQQKRRHRILPRTVIGISGMLMTFGIGAAFSGAAFYAYYDDRLAQNEQEIARFVDGFDQQFTDASGSLDQLRTESIEQIRTELSPLGDYVSDANGVIELPATVGPSVWTVETRNEAGVPVVGSAFAVTGHEGGTALITSYSVVAASAATPRPSITLVKGDQRVDATLWNWDVEHDLALLVTASEIPALELADPTRQGNALGARVFAMSGTGGQGATASPGVLIDQSELGLQHTAALGSLFDGGPLVDSDGEVHGVASTDYRPLGDLDGQIHQAPDIAAICARVLRCADGTALSTGDASG